jgi:myo-inositol catabolism protein IolC
VDLIFALAFDHRDSFRRSFMGLSAPPSPAQHRQMVAAKAVVVDALVAAATGGAVREGRPTLLIDHEYGADFVAPAQRGGVAVAMPLEVSGQRELRYLFDGDFGCIVDRYKPDYAKVLVRYNPGGDAPLNARQRIRLRALAEWLQGRPQKFMLELLVPPEDHQLASVADDRGRFDRELRATLTVRAIEEIAHGGIRPHLWKIEGPESREDAERVAAAVRAADADGTCLVLGRGADLGRVRQWLTTAAATGGFAGFAVGRTLWWDALRGFLGGGDRDTAVTAIAHRYLALTRDYVAARRAMPRPAVTG